MCHCSRLVASGDATRPHCSRAVAQARITRFDKMRQSKQGRLPAWIRNGRSDGVGPSAMGYILRKRRAMVKAGRRHALPGLERSGTIVEPNARWYSPCWLGPRIGLCRNAIAAPAEEPRPKAGPPVRRPSSGALRDCDQSDKSLGVALSTWTETMMRTGRRSPGCA